LIFGYFASKAVTSVRNAGASLVVSEVSHQVTVPEMAAGSFTVWGVALPSAHAAALMASAAAMTAVTARGLPRLILQLL
jgi:hypothetical protein